MNHNPTLEFLCAVREQAGQIALISGDITRSYAELDDASPSVARLGGVQWRVHRSTRPAASRVHADAIERDRSMSSCATRSRRLQPGELSAPRAGDSVTVLAEAVEALAALRTPCWLGHSAVGLHALASFIAQSRQMVPAAVSSQDRDQGHIWGEIGPVTRPLPRQPQHADTGTIRDPLDTDHPRVGRAEPSAPAARRRATSVMSLHCRVRHVADGERNLFRRVQRQPGLPAIFWTDEARDADSAPLDEPTGGSRAGRVLAKPAVRLLPQHAARSSPCRTSSGTACSPRSATCSTCTRRWPGRTRSRCRWSPRCSRADLLR